MIHLANIFSNGLKPTASLDSSGANSTDLETSSAASAALTRRQEVEERLVTMREKMEAIRTGGKNPLVD